MGLTTAGGVIVATATVLKDLGVVATALTYQPGECIGGLLTVANALGAAHTGTLESLMVLDMDSFNEGFNVLLFSAAPTASTFTDGAAPVLHANDTGKLIGGAAVSATSIVVTLGTPVLIIANNLGVPLVGSSTTLYAAVIRDNTVLGDLTFSGTGKLIVKLGIMQD